MVAGGPGLNVTTGASVNASVTSTIYTVTGSSSAGCMGYCHCKCQHQYVPATPVPSNYSICLNGTRRHPVRFSVPAPPSSGTVTAVLRVLRSPVPSCNEARYQCLVFLQSDHYPATLQLFTVRGRCFLICSAEIRVALLVPISLAATQVSTTGLSGTISA